MFFTPYLQRALLLRRIIAKKNEKASTYAFLVSWRQNAAKAHSTLNRSSHGTSEIGRGLGFEQLSSGWIHRSLFRTFLGRQPPGKLSCFHTSSIFLNRQRMNDELSPSTEKPLSPAFIRAPPKTPSSQIQPLVDILHQLDAKNADVAALQRQLALSLRPWHGSLNHFQVGSILCHVAVPHVALLFHRWAQSQEDYQASIVVYTILSSILRDSGLLRRLLEEVKQKQKQQQLQPNTNFFNRIMRSFQEAGDVRGALEAHVAMQECGCTEDLHTFRTLVRLYRDVSDFGAAMAALAEMRRRGLEPSTYTYGILIDLCAKVRRPREAGKLMREMLDRGLEPGIVTYNTLIKAYMASGEVDMALDVFWEVQRKEEEEEEWRGKEEEEGEEAQARGGRKRRFESDSITYLSILNGLRKSWRHEEAMEVVARLERSRVEISCQLYTCVMCLFGERGEVVTARHMFEEMEKYGHKKDKYAYSSIMHVYGRVGWVEEAMEVLEEMKESGIKPDNLTYGILVDALRHAGRFDEAQTLISDMESPEEGGRRFGGESKGGIMYAVQVQGLLDAKKYDEVINVLEKMRGSGVEGPLKLYCSLVAEYTKCTNQEGLDVLVRAMSLVGHPVHQMVLLLLRKPRETPPEELQKWGEKKGGKGHRREGNGANEEEAMWREVRENHLERLQASPPKDGAHRFIDVVLSLLDAMGYRERAVRLWEEAKERRLFHPTLSVPDPRNALKWSINLAHYEPGGAAMVVLAELCGLRRLAQEEEVFPDSFEVIVGLGSSSPYGNEGPGERVTRMLVDDWLTPFEVNVRNRGRLVADGVELRTWLRSSKASRILSLRNRAW